MAKNNSELKSIQKKLMAAIAMVLVASVMVVSSSYAWFTLSTAPEVTGIQTSVGSNGNLEMALRLEKDLNAITTTTTGGTFPEANQYWGNLVDLSHSDYHLSDVALAPARLNITLDEGNCKYSTTTDDNVPARDDGAHAYAEGQSYKDGVITAVENGTTEGTFKITYKTLVKAAYKLRNSAYLQTPVYGVDGRVQSLATDNVINGKYIEAAKGFASTTTDAFGVRAIGTSSSMTPEEMALRSAKQAVSAAISTSKSSATASLRDDSVKLANIIVTGFVEDGASFTSADTAAIQKAIDNLNGIAVSLRDAINQTIIAVGVAQNKTVAADQITFGSNTITAGGIDWTGLENLQATLIKANTTLVDMEGKLSAAQSKVTAITKTTGITFDEIKEPLTTLLSTGDFDIIDSASGRTYSVSQLQSMMDTDLMTVAKILMSTPTISIKNGVYYDIALFSGNYSATTEMSVDVTYGDISTAGSPISVIMATNAAEPAITDALSGYYLTVILNQLSSVTINVPADGEGSTDVTRYTVVTDIYGYAIDLAFRTNASGSSLMLQTDARNRVEDSASTQGGGSYMQFTTANDEFTLLQVADLMNSVRVVFMNDAGNIFGIAVMEVSYEAVMDGEGETATHVDFAAGTDGHDLDINGKAYTLTGADAVTVDGKTYLKAPLYLYGYSIDASGKLTLGDKLTSNVLTALNQNEPTAVTSVVYLDGDTVENADVAINGSSMTGTMNLQFASSAELDPMDYTFAEKLGTPEITLNEGKISWTAVDKASAYEVYINGNAAGIAVQGTDYDLNNLTTAASAYAGQKVSICITAVGDNYLDSAKSNSVEYTIPSATPNP